MPSRPFNSLSSSSSMKCSYPPTNNPSSSVRKQSKPITRIKRTPLFFLRSSSASLRLGRRCHHCRCLCSRARFQFEMKGLRSCSQYPGKDTESFLFMSGCTNKLYIGGNFGGYFPLNILVMFKGEKMVKGKSKDGGNDVRIAWKDSKEVQAFCDLSAAQVLDGKRHQGFLRKEGVDVVIEELSLLNALKPFVNLFLPNIYHLDPS